MASEQVRQHDEFQEVDEDIEPDELDDYDDPAALDEDPDPADDEDADEASDADDDEPDAPEEEGVGDEDEEDEEESLEALLTRGREIDDSEVDSQSRHGLAPVTQLVGAGEFTCRSCFLVKRRAQLADAERLICRDCV
ncbi:hypothetical protein BH20ACT9_BH20ACT9_19660 [soil metagenome]